MNTREKPSYSGSRTRQTIEFCDIPKGSTVLDIAEPNELSKQLAKEKQVKIINTVSDLDYKIIPQRMMPFKFVTCFEVIEHLLNPRLFFDNLRKITPKDVVVYLSYPSRPWWAENRHEHFNEYSRVRFEYLLEKTGWKIVREKKIYVRRRPVGIRPVIRSFMPQTGIYELHKV